VAQEVVEEGEDTVVAEDEGAVDVDVEVDVVAEEDQIMVEGLVEVVLPTLKSIGTVR